MADATPLDTLPIDIVLTLTNRDSYGMSEWATDAIAAGRKRIAERYGELKSAGVGFLESELRAKAEWLAARLAVTPRPWLAGGLTDQRRGELWCEAHGKRPCHQPERPGLPFDWRSEAWEPHREPEHALPADLFELAVKYGGGSRMYATEAAAHAAVGTALRAMQAVLGGEGDVTPTVNPLLAAVCAEPMEPVNEPMKCAKCNQLTRVLIGDRCAGCNPFRACRKCHTGTYVSAPQANWMNRQKCDTCGHTRSR